MVKAILEYGGVMMKAYRLNNLTSVNDTISNLVKETTPSIAILQNDTHCVFYKPNDNRVNIDLCNELHIPRIPIASTRGPVISNVGDIAAMIWIPKYKSASWGAYVFKSLQMYLTKQNLKITLQSNDILLYGRKIGGYSEEVTPAGVIGVLFIAMEDAQDIVNQICLKHTDKKTTGLYDYGITANEIKSQIIEISERYISILHLEGGR